MTDMKNISNCIHYIWFKILFLVIAHCQPKLRYKRLNSKIKTYLYLYLSLKINTYLLFT